MGTASEFFGIDFGTTTTEVAKPAPKEEHQGLVGRALSFFGIDFGATPKEKPKAAPTPAVVPSKPIMESEAKMKVAAQFTPAEEKARELEMRSPAAIKELQGELARATNPKIKKILSEELAKLQRK